MQRKAVSQVTHLTGWRSSVLLAAVLSLLSTHTARAAGVVGTGTPESCTEAALDAALPGGGLVTFNCGASPATITVTSTKTLGARVTIDGGSKITISGGNKVSVFFVYTVVTIRNMTIANAKGAIEGCGIFKNCRGGAIYNDGGTVNVTGSTFTSNIAGSEGGGGAINNNDGTVNVTDSTFSANSADPVGGGAIYSYGPAATLTVTGSTFSGNSAGRGGAIRNSNGALVTVTSSTFSANSTEQGGAISNGSMVTVTDSTFTANVGGSIANGGGGTVTVLGSTFLANSTRNSGAAIYNDGSHSMITVTNCTFSGNQADYGGGAIYNDDISPNDGSITVISSTFFGNSAGGFGGGAIRNHQNNGPLMKVTLINSIVANGTSQGNCAGSVTDAGHNIEDGTTCGFTGSGCTNTSGSSFCGTNPMLDPTGLANNGGPTQTIALQAGSPAFNAGDEAVCAADPVNNLDQRGYIRPGAGAASCSIGAYEDNSIPLSNVCCQCPASCAAPVNGTCGECTTVFGGTCKDEALCVLYTPTPSPTPTATVPAPTPTASPTPTATILTPTPTPSPTPTSTIPTPTPTETATNTPSSNDCCQCADFCAAPIAGTCGGCAVVFGASCNGVGQCISQTPPTSTPTAKPCVGSCKGDSSVAIDDIVTLVNIALGTADASACPHGNPGGGPVTIDLIVQAVNNALSGCP